MNGFRLLAVLIPLFTSAGGRGVSSSSDIITPTILKEWYVAADGLDTTVGDDINFPWSLEHARDNPLILPGHRVNVRGGDYTGLLGNITTGGTASLPVIWRNYNNERARCRSSQAFAIDAPYFWWHGIEVCGPAGMDRISTQTEGDLSQPTDITRCFIAPNSGASRRGIRIIGAPIHDVDQGPFAGPNSPEFELSECPMWNIGWEGSDRPHGHIFYGQNVGPELHQYRDNVVFGSFSNLVKYAGSGSSFEKHILLEGNALLHAGEPSAGALSGPHLLVHIANSDPTHIGNLYLRKNSFYAMNSRLQAVWIGDSAFNPGPSDVELTDNICHGRIEVQAAQRLTSLRNKMYGFSLVGTFRDAFHIRKATGLTLPQHEHIIDYNQYAWASHATFKGLLLTEAGGSATLYTLPEWQPATGYDLNSTYVNGLFPVADMVYRPSRYEAHRGFTHCWNWQSLATLPIDLSMFGFQPGMLYEMHNSYDLFGGSAAAGEYTGALIDLEQTGYTYPPVQDYPNDPGVPPAEKLNVFQVRRTG